MKLLKLSKCIGRGGFGTIHLATYAGTSVAVKKINITGEEEKATALRDITALL